MTGASESTERRAGASWGIWKVPIVQTILPLNSMAFIETGEKYTYVPHAICAGGGHPEWFN
ncbi:hypothetical protein GCM10011321_40450 [Youhaiella tibetensis]|nr:hypothetical protein GCM10011321_40450 [Youhaiella tibetensis]